MRLNSRKSVADYFEAGSDLVFLLFVFAYAVLLCFQGLDLADEGFNTVLYKNFYSHPESTQYSLMFWFSGFVGGTMDQVFPNMGLLGFRILGAVFITATCTLAYYTLKPFLKKGALRIGLLLALLVISNNIRIFHYNYLCAFLYVSTAFFLVRGLLNNRIIFIFLAGAMVALEALARVPSLVNIGLVSAIVYYGIINKHSFKLQLRQVLAFGIGFIGCLAFMLFAMKLIGHLDYYLGTLQLVKEMGSGSASTHYGASKLVYQFFVYYGSSLKHGLLLAIPVLAAFMVQNLLKDKWKAIVPAVLLVFALGILVLTWMNILTHRIYLFILVDLSLIAAVLIFLGPASNKTKLLSFIGAYVLLTYPLGSSDGLITVGIYSLWIILPVAVDYFNQWQSVNNPIVLQQKESNAWSINLGISPEQLRKLGIVGTIILFVGLLYHAYYYPFFDYHERTKMRYQVDNKYLRGIYMTKERAQAINELLTALSPHIKPGDKVLMYHSIPMIHYMTETRPYTKNSMPWLYEGTYFGKELNAIADSTNSRPVIVRQLIKTVGDASYWPDPPKVFDTEWDTINKGRDEALDDFIRKHGYKKTWGNGIFDIYIP